MNNNILKATRKERHDDAGQHGEGGGLDARNRIGRQYNRIVFDHLPRYRYHGCKGQTLLHFMVGIFLCVLNIVRVIHTYQKDFSDITRFTAKHDYDYDAGIVEDDRTTVVGLNHYGNHLLPTTSSNTITFQNNNDIDNNNKKKIQGICGKRHQQQIPTSGSPTKQRIRHPKFLFGIPSTLSSLEGERRQLFRETFLSFDEQLQDFILQDQKKSSNNLLNETNARTSVTIKPNNYVMNRVCSVQDWTCNYQEIHEDCQIIYAFFVGGNATAPPFILDESLSDFRSMLTSDVSQQQPQQRSLREPGLISLNIRENQFDGKMTTWFQFAALVGQEYPELDYAVKADSDTLVFTPNFLEHLEMRHWDALAKINSNKVMNRPERIYGGVKLPKTSCGKKETHHPCPLSLVGDTYMSGELNFMSMDLARYIASDACPRDNITLPHEDVSLSNYVYSYTNNSNVLSSSPTKNTTIERIFIHPERLLLTFNQSADWESRKLGRTVNLKQRFRRYLWGHCNAKPMKNDALYTYFKNPDTVRKVWNDFMTYYYEGIYKTTSDGATDQKLPEKNDVKAVSKKKTTTKTKQVAEPDHSLSSSCAILFFGLPRSFKRYVLPSIIRNVIIPNLKYGCDYYVHYYNIENEESSRSGNGGSIDPDIVLLLGKAIQQIYNHSSLKLIQGIPANYIEQPPHVSFSLDTNATFWEARGELVKKYRTYKGRDGNYLYFPYKSPNYVYPSTMDNIVRQWHSIDAVWNEMEINAQKLGKKYKRVAMLRNDVVFMTPLDIYKLENLNFDVKNEYAIIPNWANWPVNDRMISGPYEAVKIWATERFRRLDHYVMTKARQGDGLHPERFLNYELFPVMTNELGYKLNQNKRICFVRVRADGGIWIDDCTRDGGRFPQNSTYLLQKNLLPNDAICHRKIMNEYYDQLYCDFDFADGENLLWNLEMKPIKSNVIFSRN